ncbi:hypothetical protein [Luedemannella helvata]|uniref:Uncharacterized protein n=1 Tax=Luedemannella helvata TaxID=349315 RepID=A0ABP4WEI2_9ACTN
MSFFTDARRFGRAVLCLAVVATLAACRHDRPAGSSPDTEPEDSGARYRLVDNVCRRADLGRLTVRYPVVSHDEPVTDVDVSNCQVTLRTTKESTDSVTVTISAHVARTPSIAATAFSLASGLDSTGDCVAVDALGTVARRCDVPDARSKLHVYDGDLYLRVDWFPTLELTAEMTLLARDALTVLRAS